MKDVSAAERSAIMRAVKGRDTGPEVTVRRLLHGLGYRYSLCRKDLPGKPDIVFGKKEKIIFVHGCFWHGHSCRRGARVPNSNQEYWLKKVSRNKERDGKNLAALKSQGWKSLVVWECETRNKVKLEKRVVTFLSK